MEKKWPSLAKAPVVTAIFQLKFDNDSVKVDDYLKFDNVLKREFPKRSDNIESSLSLSLATKIPLGRARVSGVTNTRRTGYVYFTVDQKEKLSLSSGDITYTTENPYEGWEVFRNKVLRILDIVSSIMENVTLRRTSIRFINQFKFDDFRDPTEYFNSQISSTEGGMLYPLMKYGFRLTYDVDEGIYSIVNQNAEHLPDKYIYIFDIDVLNRNNLLFDLSAIADTMDRLRDIKNEIFFGNVTKKTLQSCN